MLQSLYLFLAPGNSPVQPTAQATHLQPPAISPLSSGAVRGRASSIKFAARMVGNAIGFSAMLAGCWFSLQILQSFL
jgi:hypothetical protein